MATKNPRINITLSLEDLEIIQILAKQKNMSQAALIKKMVEEWLEDYEDFLLAVRAMEAEKEWEKGGKKTYSFEEVWKKHCS